MSWEAVGSVGGFAVLLAGYLVIHGRKEGRNGAELKMLRELFERSEQRDDRMEQRLDRIDTKFDAMAEKLAHLHGQVAETTGTWRVPPPEETMSTNGADDDDDSVPPQPYRIPRNPEAMWYVRQLANYEMALREAVRDIHILVNKVADAETPPPGETMRDMSRAAANIANASNQLAYGINPDIERRKAR